MHAYTNTVYAQTSNDNSVDEISWSVKLILYIQCTIQKLIENGYLKEISVRILLINDRR